MLGLDLLGRLVDRRVKREALLELAHAEVPHEEVHLLDVAEPRAPGCRLDQLRAAIEAQPEVERQLAGCLEHVLRIRREQKVHVIALG